MTNRNEVIDFIRGFSILSVILLHCKIHLKIDESLLSITWVKWLLSSGYYGVMSFFVVSGFLITSTCIRKWNKLQSINIGQFYLMRFSRIIPCLVALLTVLSFLHLIGIKKFIIQNTSLQQSLFSALTFQINWLEAKVGYLPANWDILWSLSVEEIFYLFFPLLCLMLRNKKHLVFAMFIFILIGPLARTKFTDNDIWGEHSYLSCMDGIAIGCLAAMFADKLRSITLSRFLFTLGCLLFGFIFFFRRQAFDIGITSLGLNVTLLEIGIAMIILATQQVNFKWFNSIRWFGRNSYEIYLTHSFVVLFVAGILYRSNQPTWLIVTEYLVVVLCSGLLGQLIASYYSEPLNRYIREKSFIPKLSYSLRSYD
ncbi:MAG: acyltransferase [Gammaproteobacteria bacterium]|nr:acyltransferase [Gammaproteobacteria bacterium]